MADVAQQFDPDGYFSRQHAVIRIVLGSSSRRPGAGLPVKVAGRLQAWARDADLYALTLEHVIGNASQPSHDVVDQARAVAEADLMWRLECFSKPTVALLNGTVSTPVLGLALAGTHQAVGADFEARIDDLARGQLPAAPVLHALAQLPGRLGAFVVLTQAHVRRNDALGLGLISHCVEATQFEAIATALSEAEPVDPVLDDRHQPPAASQLKEMAALIDAHFTSDDPEAIKAAAAVGAGEHKAAFEAALDRMAAVPLFVRRVALRAMKQARGRSLMDTLALVHRVNAGLVAATAVTSVDSVFALRAVGELELPARSVLQSLRRA